MAAVLQHLVMNSSMTNNKPVAVNRRLMPGIVMKHVVLRRGLSMFFFSKNNSLPLPVLVSPWFVIIIRFYLKIMPVKKKHLPWGKSF